MLRPLELLDIQLETLLDRDARGRISLRVRDSGDRRPPPRLYLGRTREGHRLRLRADLPDALAARLESIAAREPHLATLEVPPAPPDPELAAALGPWEREYRGPAFLLPEVCADASRAEPVTAHNVARLAGPFPWLVDELAEVSPAVVRLERGAAVAVCHCARRGTRAAEAGVETVPDARGRGHAQAAVRAWAAQVRDTGRLPLYSTWWENGASLAVAQALGAIAYAEDFHLS